MARNDRGDLFDLNDMGDEEIRGLILQELRDQPNLDAETIEVIVEDGRVKLEGRVGTDAEASVAANVVTDLFGPESFSNDLVVDEVRRGQRAEGADEAAMEEDELESQISPGKLQQSDTAEHLQEDLEEETWGTHDMQTAVRNGTVYTPPDHPAPDGYDSREDH